MTAPNIVLILVDDLGWRDLGSTGSAFYETPNIDRLAAEGMRFTDAYAACPVCSPTRASILAGQYPARIGVTDFIHWGGGSGARGRLLDAPNVDRLPLTHASLAAALREGGYATWHVGKWHLGPEETSPQKHGFDMNVGGCEWGMPVHGYFAPWNIPGLANAEDGTYLVDHLGARAADLVRNREPERPFFLNYWPYAVHVPIQAKPEKIAKYEAKARALGLDQVKTFEEGEHFPCAHKADRRVRRRLVQSDAAYAAMIESLDESVGRLLDTLEDEKIAENTIVIFTSDNGGLATAEGSPTCNAPLAEGKGWMFEGGTREPLLVRWPGVVRPGSICETPVTSPDFYPTLLAAAGLPPRPAQHRDGADLTPLLRETGGLAREAIFWHYPHYGNQGGTPGCAMRAGDWKLIEFFEDDRLELYNLREDPSETRDRAKDESVRASRMHERLKAWRADVEAILPEPNPGWTPPSG